MIFSQSTHTTPSPIFCFLQFRMMSYSDYCEVIGLKLVIACYWSLSFINNPVRPIVSNVVPNHLVNAHSVALRYFLSEVVSL